jgi:hypothetical protein
LEQGGISSADVGYELVYIFVILSLFVVCCFLSTFTWRRRVSKGFVDRYIFDVVPKVDKEF